MHSLKLLLRAGPAALLLVLCLQFRINEAQEDRSTWKVLIFNVSLPQRAKANEEVTLQLNLKTELRECIVVKGYLVSNAEFSGSFYYRYTRCLCNDNPVNLFWDFEANRTATIAVVVDIVEEQGICPNDWAVVPFNSKQYYTLRYLRVY